MTLYGLQRQIAQVLNDDETLMQGGCEAFAEDSNTIGQDVARRLKEVAGVAIVVSTPSAEPAGRKEGEIQLDTAIEVAAAEIPALNRDPSGGKLTALQAAQRLIMILDGPSLEFTRLRQRFDEQVGVATTTCEFTTQVALTEEDN
jgi:hypothetical protein